jgi:ankyrin repeat protein
MSYVANPNRRLERIDYDEIYLRNQRNSRIEGTDLDDWSDSSDSSDFYRYWTPLHFAAQNNHIEVVKILLSNGAYFNAKTSGDQSPFDLSMDLSDVEYLLNSVAQLFKAVHDNDFDKVKKLLEVSDSETLKIILNARNRDDKTILQVAKTKDDDIEMLLIEKLRKLEITEVQL